MSIPDIFSTGGGSNNSGGGTSTSQPTNLALGVGSFITLSTNITAWQSGTTAENLAKIVDGDRDVSSSLYATNAQNKWIDFTVDDLEILVVDRIEFYNRLNGGTGQAERWISGARIDYYLGTVIVATETMTTEPESTYRAGHDLDVDRIRVTFTANQKQNFREFEIHGVLSLKGQKGETGPQGNPGTNGRDGTDGTDGTNGTNGTDGTDGTNGTNGTAGAAGAPGTNGAVGASGADGDSVEFKGTYNHATTYRHGDLVRHNGIIYHCNIISATAVVPDAAPQNGIITWTIFAEDGTDITEHTGNLALSHRTLMALTTTVTSWHAGTTAENLASIVDGVTSTTGDLNFVCAPQSANGKYIAFKLTTGGLFLMDKVDFFNRADSGTASERITSSLLEYRRAGVVLRNEVMTGANVSTYLGGAGLYVDEVRIVFNGDLQNFREIEVYGTIPNGATGAKGDKGDPASRIDNFALASEGIMTLSTTITTWQSGTTAENLAKIADGDKTTSPYATNAQNKYIEFTVRNDEVFTLDRLEFYNRLNGGSGQADRWINLARIDYYFETVIVATETMTTQAESTYTAARGLEVDVVRITFTANNLQNFREIEIFGSLSLKGKKGDTGPAGARGPAGPAGADGAASAKGDTGAAGADGTDGAKGDTGATGARGPTGPKGADGADGAAGTDGTGVATIDGNLALASRSLMVVTTNVTSYIVGTEASNFAAINDGVTSTTGALNYACAPSNANGKYIEFKLTDGEVFKFDRLEFFNRAGSSASSRITGSTLEYRRVGTVLATETMTGENESTYTNARGHWLDAVRLVFSGNDQNFREIEVYGLIPHGASGATGPAGPIGLTGPAGVKGDDGDSVEFKGVYNHSVTYRHGELVRYEGKVYHCNIISSTGTIPSAPPQNNVNNWTVVVEDGVDGTSGLTEGNLALSSKNIMELTTNITSWGSGTTATNLANVVDGNTSTSFSATNAQNKWIEFKLKNNEVIIIDYIKIFNTLDHSKESQIVGSSIDCYLGPTNVSSELMVLADQSAYIDARGKEVDRIIITFLTDQNQDFRELEIFGALSLKGPAGPGRDFYQSNGSHINTASLRFADTDAKRSGITYNDDQNRFTVSKTATYSIMYSGSIKNTAASWLRIYPEGNAHKDTFLQHMLEHIDNVATIYNISIPTSTAFKSRVFQFEGIALKAGSSFSVRINDGTHHLNRSDRGLDYSYISITEQ